MKIQFDFEEIETDEYTLTATTADGLEITIYFDGLDADTISTNLFETHVTSDDYKGLYVDFGTKLVPHIMSLTEVIQQANAQIDDFVKENQPEKSDYDEHFNQADFV